MPAPSKSEGKEPSVLGSGGAYSIEKPEDSSGFSDARRHKMVDSFLHFQCGLNVVTLHFWKLHMGISPHEKMEIQKPEFSHLC